MSATHPTPNDDDTTTAPDLPSPERDDTRHDELPDLPDPVEVGEDG
ncbi:hypothetical protein [Burkholderia pseudomultivorans]|nr:hypothetical protein [Burkholderia pseudomultivorans]